MFETPAAQSIRVFPLLLAVLTILMAVLSNWFLRLIGLQPLSSVFTNAGFRRSAQITEKLGRLVLLLLGAGFLIRGAGPPFLAREVILAATALVLGLSGLIVLAMIVVILAHWRAPG